MRRMFSALAVVALLGVAAAQAAPPTDKPEAAPKETAQAAPAAKAPDITPETANALGAMCEFLKAQPVMAFRAEVSQEQVYPKGQTVQVNRVLDVVLRRPDKLYARVTGDGRDRLFVYDGKTATRADLDKGVYAVLDAPATVDALLTMLEEKYGIVAPLSDILYADPCASLLDDVQVGDTLGDHLAAGKSCRHLLFTQKNADWQLWIENGKEPVPPQARHQRQGKNGLAPVCGHLRAFRLPSASFARAFYLHPGQEYASHRLPCLWARPRLGKNKAGGPSCVPSCGDFRPLWRWWPLSA